MRLVFGFAFVLLASVVLALSIVPRFASWHAAMQLPDGFWYARMMLEDRRQTRGAAETIDEAFFAPLLAHSPDPNLRARFEPAKPRLFEMERHMFLARPVYPYLASLLYGHFGFSALMIVSTAAYILGAIAIYWLLSQFVQPSIATVVAVAAMLSPWQLRLAGAPITDMSALTLYTMLLAAGVLYARGSSIGWLALFGVFCALLTFTRPAIYLPVGAAIGVLVFGIAVRDTFRMRRGLAMLGLTIAVGAIYALYTVSIHAPGLRGQIAYLWTLHMQSGSYRDLPEATWYVLIVGRTVAELLKDVITNPLMLLLAAIGAFGLYMRRNDSGTAVLLGASAALGAAILANPIFAGLMRTVELPLTPTVACGVACTFAALIAGTKTTPRKFALNTTARRRLDMNPSKSHVTEGSGL